MEERIVNATKGSIEKFKESIIWADIVAELNDWKFRTEQEMLSLPENAAKENLSTAATLMHIGGLSGISKAVDYLLTIPDFLLDRIEDQKENKDEPERKED